MSSQGGLLSVHSKNFVKFCVVLSNTYVWAWFFISLGNCKDGVHMCVLCVYVALMNDFYLRKNPKTSGVIVVCSGLESIGNSLKIRNMWNIGKLKIFFALLLWCMTSETFLTNLF